MNYLCDPGTFKIVVIVVIKRLTLNLEHICIISTCGAHKICSVHMIVLYEPGFILSTNAELDRADVFCALSAVGAYGTLGYVGNPVFGWQSSECLITSEVAILQQGAQKMFLQSTSLKHQLVIATVLSALLLRYYTIQKYFRQRWWWALLQYVSWWKMLKSQLRLPSRKQISLGGWGRGV